MKPRFNQSFFLIAALLLVHLIFFLSSLIYPPESLSDSEDYLNASKNLYSRGVLYCGDLSEPIVEEQLTRRPPLYPILLGIQVLTRSNIPIFLLQIIISMVAIVLVGQLFMLQTNQRLSIFALILILGTPAQFIYANRIMAEVPFQLLLVLMAWSVFKYFQLWKIPQKQADGNRLKRIKDPSNQYIWLFNLFLTMGMAMKPVLFPFAILIMLLSFLLFIRIRKYALILVLLLPLCWIVLYSAWNYKRTGSAQYSSIQTANMVNYNLKYFIMGQNGSESAQEQVDQLYSKCELKTSYIEKKKCLEEGVREVIFEKPVQYGVYHLKGCVRYFLDPGRFDVVTFFNIRKADSPGFLKTLNQDGLSGAMYFLKQQGLGLMAILSLLALFKLLKATGFLLYLFRSRSQLQLRIFLAILVGYLALVTGPLGASRFLLPVELLVIGAALRGWAPILGLGTDNGAD